MATPLVRTARLALNCTRQAPSGSSAARLNQRRGLAGTADHHGSPKVNIWQDPLSPAKWKEEHFVIASLSFWGLLFYGGYKLFTRGSKDKDKGEKLAEGTQ